MIHLTAEFTPSALFHHGAFREPVQRLLERADRCWLAGDLKGAERYAQEARLSSREVWAHVEEAAALIRLSDVYREMGRLGPALRSAREAYDLLSRQPGLVQRHNEGVAAYNLGVIHHLLGNEVEALNWYQTARQVLKLAREYWAARKGTDLVRTCRRLEQWIAELSDSLTREEGRGGLLSTLILPAQLIGDGDGHASVTELRVEGYLLGPRLVIGDRSFQVHPLTGGSVIIRAGEVYRVFEIPEEACPPTGARKGDYVLMRQAEPEGPDRDWGVLEGEAGPDFGHFRREEGRVSFESWTTGRVIGGLEGGDFSLYAPLALLRPIN